MIEFLKFIKELKTQLAIVGEKVEDAILIHIMLNELSPTYEGFIQTIITQDPLSSFEKLVKKLLYEEYKKSVCTNKSDSKEALLLQLCCNIEVSYKADNVPKSNTMQAWKHPGHCFVYGKFDGH